MSEPTHDLLPLYDASRGFDTAMRGYDRAQVEPRGRPAGRRLAAHGRRTRLGGSAQCRPGRPAGQRPGPDRVVAPPAAHRERRDHRSQRQRPRQADARRRGFGGAEIARTGGTDAAQTRSDADDSAARTRAAAQADAERIIAEATARMAEAENIYRTRTTEADAHQAAVEQALAESEERTRTEESRLSAQAEATRNRLDTESAAERQRLDSESLEARTRAQEDFEITLRLRRTTAQDEQAHQKRTADAEAARTVSDARARARQLIADATHEVRRLHEQRNGVHADLTQLGVRLQSALDVSLAVTPDEPDLPPADAAVEPQ